MAESFSERAQSGDAAGWQCGGCDLQAIEQQAGGFGVHLSADDHAHDLPERHLDGVGVLEHGQIKHAGDVMRGLAQVNMSCPPAMMEVAILAVSQSLGTACGAGAPARADSEGYDIGKRLR